MAYRVANKQEIRLQTNRQIQWKKRQERTTRRRLLFVGVGQVIQTENQDVVWH